MKVKIPPNTLKILRESMSLSTQELASKVGISLDELEEIELHGGEISYTKLKKIATTLKYPIAAFLIEPEKIPKIKPPKDKRKGYIGKSISYETMKIVKKAYLIQDYLFEKLPKPKLPILASIKDHPWEIAKVYRKALGISACKLSEFKRPKETFEYFRQTLSDKLFIYVLQFPMNLEELRGFVLIEKGKTPIIVVNSQDSEEAKIFTLFHELGHIVLGEKESFFDYPDPLENGVNGVEIWCNNFAASMLLPKEDLIKLLKEYRITKFPCSDRKKLKKIVREISKRLNISRSFVLVQLMKFGIAPKDLLQASFHNDLAKFDPEYSISRAKSKSEKKGGPSFTTKLFSQLGTGYVETVITDYETRNITFDRALELLSVKSKTMKKLIRGETN